MKYVYMDGDLHTTERDCCNPFFLHSCKVCGGEETVHLQYVWGGVSEVCEVCDVELWREKEQ